jgi:sarcosine oxidase gamma subunit
MGYTAFGQHSGAINAQTDMTRIPRFPASGIYANLQTLKVKLASLPFTIISLANADPVISQNPPTLTVKLKVVDFTPTRLNCFAGSQHAAVKWITDDQFTVTSPKPLPKERSRYNCTAPSLTKPGRFYWFSQPWVNLPLIANLQ